jgi:hypothetical protein
MANELIQSCYIVKQLSNALSELYDYDIEKRHANI